MPGSGTRSVLDTAKRIRSGASPDGEDAASVIDLLREYADTLDATAARLDAAIEPEYRGGELACVLEDIRAWACLSRYYLLKIGAALHLALYQLGEDEAEKAAAVELLEQAVPVWERLAEIWAGHYMPYRMARVNQTFGYTYYTEDVKRDVTLAKTAKPLRVLLSEKSVPEEGGFESHPWALDLDTH